MELFLPGILNFFSDYLTLLQFFQYDGYSSEESLGVDNTLWANTAVASGSALGIVVYTGQETRSLMNHSAIRSKVGLLDQEINQLTKVLCICAEIICQYRYLHTNV